MIGSLLGLAELAHVPAPAGITELAAASQWFQFPQVSELPILIVPGVRSGPESASSDTIHQTDVMRGEETLCVGLHALGRIQLPAIVLNLGSHWKAIRLNAEGRIEGSFTSLSGELIHAAQTQTILANSVPQERPGAISKEWMTAGMREQRRAGLARALFCVRLLDLTNQGTPEERLAFLIGAFIASDLDALVAANGLRPDVPVVIAGYDALAEAWRDALAGRPVTVLTQNAVEAALLEGLRRILVEARGSESPLMDWERNT